MRTDEHNWENKKNFRDPVHQYIEVPKPYVNSIIDTFEVQRIKNVAQSGLHSVYNAATHDRFSHSLGVYNLGLKAYENLRKNILKELGKISDHTQYYSIYEQTEKKLIIYRNLFNIACLLHDIGHPAMSHTLEFLYDDMYMKLEEATVTVSENEYKRFKAIRENSHKRNGEFLDMFRKALYEKIYNTSDADETEYTKLSGSPHERMSAYYILMGLQADGESLKSGSMADNIRSLIISYNNSMVNPRHTDDTCCTEKSYDIADYLRFICRMIIGEKYIIHKSYDLVQTIDMSIRNCIISLLNGQIDVDSLDYIARNSYSAGYDTNKVDVNRLCNAFSVRWDGRMFIPVFEKHALSVLEGFISARHYEPNWLYSHHKIVYNIDVLYKSLYRKLVDLLFEDDIDKWSKILLGDLDGDDYYKNKIKPSDLECDKCKDTDACIQSIISADSQNFTSLRQFFCAKLADVKKNNKDIEAYTKFLGLILNKISLYEEHPEDSHDICSELHRIIDEYAPGEMRESFNEKVDFVSPSISPLVYRTGSFTKKAEDLSESDIKKAILKTRCYLKDLDNDNYDDKRKCIDILKKLNEKYNDLEDIRNLYFSYIISPCCRFKNDKYTFYRSTDSDIYALFKHFFLKFKDKSELNANEREFYNLAEEYFNRTYKRSIWKSYQEYMLFIKGIEKETSISSTYINNCFLSIIRAGGKHILFHNDKGDFGNNEFNEQTVYKMWDEGDVNTDNSENIVNFKNIFSCIENTDFVIHIHEIKYKNFGDKIKIAFKDKVMNLNEILSVQKSDNIKFPYIYVSTDEDMIDIRKKLSESLKNYCITQYSKSFKLVKGDNDFMVNQDGTTVFRDVVHGDIEIPKKYMLLIETKAFQRLRRIKQLSTADYVFTNAAHTRFSHCIGTFYIMSLMIKHFTDIFKNIGICYNTKETEALLVAALLHDIGHGPYSHNFERMSDSGKTHETWTVEIIKNDPEIQQILKNEFCADDDFTSLVISYILDDGKYDRSNLSLHTIFKSLISSQMDADRFDYLLRDSYNTSIGYGNIDIKAIIRGMQVTEYKNKFYVCISQNVLPYVEQFIFGRYNMYDTVYYNPYKVFSETLVMKILQYAKNHPDTKNDSSMLFQKDITLKDYLNLDDTYINGLFSTWQKSEDKILSEMCTCLLCRKGYERIYPMNQTYEDKNNFENSLIKLIKHYLPDCKKNVSELCGIIIADRTYDAYKYTKSDGQSKQYDSQIWVLTDSGILKDFLDVSSMFNGKEGADKWNTYRPYIYYNEKLLASELDIDANHELLVSIRQLIDNSNIRRHIEIEEKYECTQNDLKNVLKAFEDESSEIAQCYKIEKHNPFPRLQTDTYYDTDKFILAAGNCSLRCRKKDGNRYVYTIKKPTPAGSFDENSQFARYEYEREVPEDNLNIVSDFITANLGNVLQNQGCDLDAKSDFNDTFHKMLTVENERRKFYISDKSGEANFRFSVCLDTITFRSGDKEKKDYQIEVELESKYIHRVSMKYFTEKLEKLFSSMPKHEKLSKYRKGLEMLDLTDSMPIV